MIKDNSGNRRFYGVYRGIVVDTQDPLNKGRLRLQVPQVLLEEETGWAWASYQPGVLNVLPQVGAGVFVMFEGGDPSFPIWLGTFTEILPPEPVAVRWSPTFQATGLVFTGVDATYPTYESYYVKQGQLVTFNIKISDDTCENSVKNKKRREQYQPGNR